MKLSIALAILMSPLLHAEFVWNEKENSITLHPSENVRRAIMEKLLLDSIKDTVHAFDTGSTIDEAVEEGFSWTVAD